MGEWVDIPAVQMITIVLFVFVLTQIGEKIAFVIHQKWLDRTGRRMTCQVEDCVFKISSNDPEATKFIMEKHQSDVHSS